MKIPPETFERISGLPGEEFIAPGLRDLEHGRFETPEALLIQIARTRLANAGFTFLTELHPSSSRSPESLLYESLSHHDSETAYPRYTSLKRRLDSFIHSFEGRQAP